MKTAAKAKRGGVGAAAVAEEEVELAETAEAVVSVEETDSTPAAEVTGVGSGMTEVMAINLVTGLPRIGSFSFADHFDLPAGCIPRNSRYQVPISVAIRLVDTGQFILTGGR